MILPAKYRRKESLASAYSRSPPSSPISHRRETPELDHYLSSPFPSSSPPSTSYPEFSSPSPEFRTSGTSTASPQFQHRRSTSPYISQADASSWSLPGWCSPPQKRQASPCFIGGIDSDEDEQNLLVDLPIKSPIHKRPNKRRISASPTPMPTRSSSPMSVCTKLNRQPVTANKPARKRKRRCTSPEPQRCNSPPIARKRQSASPKPEEELDNEWMGCLIQALALSRKSSMPAPALVTAVLASQPHLVAQEKQTHWLQLARDMLNSHPVFGCIHREGLDAHDVPLEDEYFYLPEKDSDRQRAQILQELMPGGGKRKATKRSAQYYFEPISMSRWDPED